MGYEPGDYFKSWLAEKQAERRDEKAFERQMQMMHEREEQTEVIRQKERQWQEMIDVTSMFKQAHSAAATPEERDAIRDSWLTYSKRLPENMRHGVEALLKNSSLSIQALNDDVWLRNNPKPPEPEFKPEDNPYHYAQMAFDIHRHKAQFMKERRNQGYTIPSEIPVDKDTYAYLDSQGDVQLESYEVRNKFADQMAEGSGMSGYALLKSGGWIDPKTVPILRTNPQTGEQSQILMNVHYNRFTHKSKVEEVYAGETKKSQKELMEGGLEAPRKEVTDLFAYLKADVKPKTDPIQMERFKKIRSLSKDYHDAYEAAKGKEKDRVKATFEQVLNKQFQEIDNRFYYALVPTEKDRPTLVEEAPFWTRNYFKLGSEANIVPIYGRPDYIKSADGQDVMVIMDHKHNRISDPVGKVLGTIPSATEMIQTHTAEQLKRMEF